VVDLAEVSLEALDAFEQLATAVRAVAAADVAAELVVLVGAVVGGGLDDDETVGEAGCNDVADAIAGLFRSGGSGTVCPKALLLPLLWRRGSGCHGLPSSSETLDRMPDTSGRDWPNGCCVADVLYAVSHIDFLLTSDELDLAVAALDLFNFLRRHHAMSATLQDDLRRRLVAVDLAEVGLEATDAPVELVVGPGAVSLAKIAA